MFRRRLSRTRSARAMGNVPSSEEGGGNGQEGNVNGTNNTASSTTSKRNHSSPFPFILRSTGSLGLSKAELDKRCKPSGLYQTCSWDDRAIRRLIGDGKLAARSPPGRDVRQDPTDRECPICFLHYKQINVTTCCQATVCTECYLQVRPQREKQSSCPFCNHPKITVTVAQDMGKVDVVKRDEEEQKVIEATIKARTNSEAMKLDIPSGASFTPPHRGGLPPTHGSPSQDGFGSRLNRQNSARLQNRSRASSYSGGASDIVDVNDTTSMDDSCLSDMTMTPEDRRSLEAEMRSQNLHPLARQMEQEAEERRVRNDQEYQRRLARYNRDMMLLRAHGIGVPSPAGPAGVGGPPGLRQPIDPPGLGQSLTRPGLVGGPGSSRAERLARMTSDSRIGMSSASRNNRSLFSDLTAVPSGAAAAPGSSGRDWNQIVDAFEEGGHGEVQSLDDLVVIEAAILLSMEEEAQRRRDQQRSARGSPAAAAAAASGGQGDDWNEDDEADEADDDDGNDNNASNEDGDAPDAPAAFDVASHARAGFPLLQSFLSRRSRGSSDDEEDDNDNENGENDDDGNNDNSNDNQDEGDSGEDEGGEAGGVGVTEDSSSSIGTVLSTSSRLAAASRASRLAARAGVSGNTSSRGGLLRSSRRPSSTHIGTAGMLMRGISEEQQVAMAIAMSLREAERRREEGEEDDEDDEEEGDDESESENAGSGADSGAGEELDNAEDTSDAGRVETTVSAPVSTAAPATISPSHTDDGEVVFQSSGDSSDGNEGTEVAVVASEDVPSDESASELSRGTPTAVGADTANEGAG